MWSRHGIPWRNIILMFLIYAIKKPEGFSYFIQWWQKKNKCAVPWVSCSAKQNFIWQISGTKSARTSPKHADMSSTTLSVLVQPQEARLFNTVVVKQARPHSVHSTNISSSWAVGMDGWISRWTDGRFLSAYSVSRVFRIEGKQRQRWDTDGRPAAVRSHGDAQQT